MNKNITIKAKENDVVFKLFQKDIFIDEIHIQIEGQKHWTIIGFKDLLMAIEKAEKKFNPKKLRICPQCGRKHKETQYNVFCSDACWNGY